MKNLPSRPPTPPSLPHLNWVRERGKWRWKGEGGKTEQGSRGEGKIRGGGEGSKGEGKIRGEGER
jgi:hypothetical protein